MNRVTVMIGAMKPMTAGHYRLITEAVADTQCPAGVNPANETYVLISMQDRIKKNQFPVRGETALSALRDIYMDPASGLFEFGADKYVKMVFCHSEKFGRENPDRVAEMREIISGIKEALAARGLSNVSAEVQQVKSGPPNVLLEMAEARPNEKFVLYTGDDDLKKYQYFKRYAENIEFAGFERFEGGMSGTEVRSLFQTDSDVEGFNTDRFSSAFPQGVDPAKVRSQYRSAAGLDPLKEIKRANKGTPEYSDYLDELMEELRYVKTAYQSRKKEGKQYRKEASIMQNAISELRRQKRKNNRLNEIENENTLNESPGIEARDMLKEWFKKNYKNIK
jgi:nicotinic acid mononucleotide adenylyltransferase